MKLKTLTPKHLRIFDDKYQTLEETKGQWKGFERAFVAAVWAGWFVEGEWPNPKSSRADIVAYSDDKMSLEDYTELCMEITRIYTLGKQSDLPVKDPNS